MARRRDEAQTAELTAFVNAIAESAGYVHTSDWARESGYAYPNLTKLRAGKGSVDGFNLLRLLRAAAARTEMTPEQLALGIARATAEDDTDESIRRRLEELANLVTEALTLLRDAQTEAQQQTGGERRSPKTQALPAARPARRRQRPA